jgi:hypothetical protein
MEASDGQPDPCQEEWEAYKKAHDAFMAKQRVYDWVNDPQIEKEMKDTWDKRGKAEWTASVSKASRETVDADVATDEPYKRWLDCLKKHDRPIATLSLYRETVGELVWRDDHWVHTGIHLTKDGASHDTQFKLSWIDSAGRQEELWKGIVFYRAGHRTTHDLIKNGTKDIELGAQALRDRQRLREIAQQQSGLEFPASQTV